MQKVKFLLFSTIASVFVYAKVCNYPFEFKLTTEHLNPVMVTLGAFNNKKYKELMLVTTDDKYTIVTDTIPATLMMKYNQKELVKKILLNKQLSDIRYLNEYKVENFLLKHYVNKDQENIVFVFDWRNKLIGTIIIEARADKLLKHIIGTFQANKNKCTKEEYLREYNRVSKREVNKKLFLLYSLILTEKDKKELLQFAKEAKKVLNLKQKLYIDLPKANLDPLIQKKEIKDKAVL